MNMYTFVVFTIILILLGILLVIFNTYDITSSNIYPKIWNNSHQLSILDNTWVCNPNLTKYCDSWGYKYINDKISSEPGYTLIINNYSTEINFNESLSFLLDIANNVEYIAFYKCSDYIIKNTSHLTREIINRELDDIDLPDNLLLNILSEGYPRLSNNGILLHRSYLDVIFKSQKLHFRLPHIMANFIPKRYNNSQTSKIPKIIHQTFQTRLIPQHISEAIHSWLDRNPTYDYYYYDDNDQRNFIKKNFNNDVLRAYDKLIPGAYKADLWRYCVIYIVGGVYIDVKMGPHVTLDKIIDIDTDLVIVNDTHNGTLYNAFFAASPYHPAILKCINVATERILNEEYGNHILYPTGPMAMGYAILPLYGYIDHAPNGKHTTSSGIIQVYSHITKNGWTNIIDMNNIELVRTRYSKPFGEEIFLYKITGSPHYRVLWQQRAIYK